MVIGSYAELDAAGARLVGSQDGVQFNETGEGDGAAAPGQVHSV